MQERTGVRHRAARDRRAGRRGRGSRADRDRVVDADPAALGQLAGAPRIAVVHEQVAHPGRRQVVLQRLPVRTVIEGHEYARIGAGIEQAWRNGIGAHHVGEMSGGQSGTDV